MIRNFHFGVLLVSESPKDSRENKTTKRSTLNKRRINMKKTLATIAVFAVFAIGTAAYAGPHHHGRGHSYHHGNVRHPGLYTTLDVVNTVANVVGALNQPEVIVNPAPAPVVVTPAPVVVTPPPQPAPVVVTPPPPPVPVVVTPPPPPAPVVVTPPPVVVPPPVYGRPVPGGRPGYRPLPPPPPRRW